MTMLALNWLQSGANTLGGLILYVFIISIHSEELSSLSPQVLFTSDLKAFSSYGLSTPPTPSTPALDGNTLWAPGFKGGITPAEPTPVPYDVETKT